MRYCLCGERLTHRQKTYCSNPCRSKYTRIDIVSLWLQGKHPGGSNDKIALSIRAYLREKAGNQCPSCGWDKIHPITGHCPLEIHHIDGDDQNHSPSNVTVLCPNCHSLTENYRKMNKSRRARVLGHSPVS